MQPPQVNGRQRTAVAIGGMMGKVDERLRESSRHLTLREDRLVQHALYRITILKTN
jgi:hypothetical protein